MSARPTTELNHLHNLFKQYSDQYVQVLDYYGTRWVSEAQAKTILHRLGFEDTLLAEALDDGDITPTKAGKFNLAELFLAMGY